MIIEFPIIPSRRPIVGGVWLSYDQVPDAIKRRHGLLEGAVASRYQVICDGCGFEASERTIGWAFAQVDIKPRDGAKHDHADFCPDCWKAMRVIARERKKTVKRA